MLLIRRGAWSNHGPKTIIGNRSPKIDWDKTSKSVKLSVERIPTTKKVSHNYDLYLSIDEIQKIIESLAEKGIVDCQNDISKKFSNQLENLLKIMTCIVAQRNTDESPKTA
jgi:hypothetical protein